MLLFSWGDFGALVELNSSVFWSVGQFLDVTIPQSLMVKLQPRFAVSIEYFLKYGTKCLKIEQSHPVLRYLQNLKYKGICNFSFYFGCYFLSILILSVKNRGCGGTAVGWREGEGGSLNGQNPLFTYISLTKVVCPQSLNCLSIEEAGSYTLILSKEHKNTLTGVKLKLVALS